MFRKLRPVRRLMLGLRVAPLVLALLIGCKQVGVDYRDLNKNGQIDPYENPNFAIEDRLDDLLSRMTLKEKAGQMIHGTFSPTADGMPPEYFVPSMIATNPPESLKKGIQEQAIGFLLTRYLPSAEAAARCTNRLQEWAENSRLGIPLIVSMDSVHGLSYVAGATIGPYNLGLAATRNMEIVKELSRILAKESRAVGIHQCLGPVADVGTEPRWGRVMETCGEDADLAAEIVKAQVKTLQGEMINKNSVLCTTKHFPGAGPEKDGVDPINFFKPGIGQLSSIVTTSETLKYHLKPFKAAIEAGSAAIMPYYSPVELFDNIPALGSYRVLVDLLREKLGYDGLICSDWLPVETLMFRGHSRDEAIQTILKADTDVFGGESPRTISDIVRLVENGKVKEEKIDNSVRRILRVKFQLGLFDDPYVDPEYAEKLVGCEDHQKVSHQASRESMTLLKNDGILPLSKDSKILVAGLRSDDMESLAGGWTGYPQPGKTLLEAIRSKISAAAQVFYEPNDPSKADETAKQAEVAIVAVGEASYVHTSPWGPEQLFLEEKQLNLIKAIQGTGIPSVVVLLMGRPYIIPWCAENVSAILAAYYPGTRGGEAVADILFGDYNPTGKLPFQMPRSMEQVINQREDTPFDIENPLYQFGHGLSYVPVKKRKP